MMYQTYDYAAQEEAAFALACTPCGIGLNINADSYYNDGGTVHTEDVSVSSSRDSYDAHSGSASASAYDIDSLACLPLGVSTFDSFAVANELHQTQTQHNPYVGVDVSYSSSPRGVIGNGFVASPLAKAIVRNATEELLHFGVPNIKAAAQHKSWTPRSKSKSQQQSQLQSPQHRQNWTPKSHRAAQSRLQKSKKKNSNKNKNRAKLQPQLQPHTASQIQICRFFRSKKGCINENCKYEHSNAPLH